MKFKKTIPTNDLIQAIFASIAILTITLMLTACGGAKLDSVGSVIPANLTPVGEVDSNGIVIKSRAAFTISTDSPSLAKTLFRNLLPSAYALTGSQGVTVVNSANSTMTLDATAFLLPAVTNAALNFGSLTVSNLQDNSLSVCGTSGKTKCGTALIQMYTSGQPGAGLWNAVEAYGVPITAKLDTTTTVQTLNTSASKVTVQSVSIAPNLKVLRNTNFANALKYDVGSDFTDAGSGSFTTTIIVEYGLSL
jgi:hypothetical protein